MFRVGVIFLLACSAAGPTRAQTTTCKDNCWSYLQCKNNWFNYFNMPSAESLCTKPTGCSCTCMTGSNSVSTTTVAASQQGTCGKDCSAFLSCKYSWEIYHGKPEVVATFCKDPVGCNCGAICYDPVVATTAAPTTTTLRTTTTARTTTTVPSTTVPTTTVPTTTAPTTTVPTTTAPSTTAPTTTAPTTTVPSTTSTTTIRPTTTTVSTCPAKCCQYQCAQGEVCWYLTSQAGPSWDRPTCGNMYTPQPCRSTLSSYCVSQGCNYDSCGPNSCRLLSIPYQECAKQL